jgi:hypothetical protein
VAKKAGPNAKTKNAMPVRTSNIQQLLHAVREIVCVETWLIVARKKGVAVANPEAQPEFDSQNGSINIRVLFLNC